MRRAATLIAAAALLAGFLHHAPAQSSPSGVSAVQHALEKLQVISSVLVIAAHPDDENNSLLAWLARGRKARTAYLSLTRGEGGQNRIGSERGPVLGLIRSEELLAARRIDGAEQFFTTAYDFGYSKTADETLAIWDRTKVLGEIVSVIREMQPDVVILEFSGTPSDGHGHHQASAILGKEAFHLAADPKAYPEQLDKLAVWQARRLLCDRCRPSPASGQAPVRLTYEPGHFDPVLGKTFFELGAESRSMHQSQAMGTGVRRDTTEASLTFITGTPGTSGIFDQIPVSWSDLPGGGDVAALLRDAADAYDPLKPARAIELLIKARTAMQRLNHPSVSHKLRELDETVAQAAGLWLSVDADRPHSSGEVALTVRGDSRMGLPFDLRSIEMEGVTVDINQTLRPNAAASHKSAWKLRHTTPVATLRISHNAVDMSLRRPVVYRTVDELLGERLQPFEVVPKLSVDVARSLLIATSRQPQNLLLRIRPTAGPAKGRVQWDSPGWTIEPASAEFDIAAGGSAAELQFRATPSQLGKARARAKALVDGQSFDSSVDFLRHSHIPVRAYRQPAETILVHTDAKVLAKTVAYIMGAGDEIPAVLRQLGCEVVLLDKLAGADLSRFDAIVTGVRAFDVRPDLPDHLPALLRYVENGGTLVVQHNTSAGSDQPVVGPFPLQIGRARVSVEGSPVTFSSPRHPLLDTPNPISTADFEGWVQERGLYFAQTWDKRYQAPLLANDPGEKPLPGGLLYARHGRGVYIFTAYSWFRQLPEGVPGAIRIFANLISAGKANK